MIGLVAAACGNKGEGSSEPAPPAKVMLDAAPAAEIVDAGVPDARGLPDSPTQAELDAAMDKIRSRVMRCNTTAFTGNITVIIDVFHYGEVEKVQIKGAPDTTLAACIARAANRAKFGRSKKGGRLSYDFVFE